MEPIIITFFACVIAVLVMAAMMYALVWDGFEHGDMIRLLGNDVTQQPKRYFTMGMVLYFASGLALSWLYYWVLDFLNFDSVVIASGFAGGIGFTQGFILMNFYIVELGTRHPSEQYKRQWLPLSFAHWFGHMVFGTAMGTMISSYLIYGMRAFYLSSLLNLIFAGGVVLFAKKGQIAAALRNRRMRHP